MSELRSKMKLLMLEEGRLWKRPWEDGEESGYFDFVVCARIGPAKLFQMKGTLG